MPQPGARRRAPRAGPRCGPGDFRSDGASSRRLAREYVRTTSQPVAHALVGRDEPDLLDDQERDVDTHEQRFFARSNQGLGTYALGGASGVISTSTSPPATVAPATVPTVRTEPATSAVSVLSIFIASRTTSGWPIATRSPGATSTASTLPGIGATTVPEPMPAAAWRASSPVSKM